MLSVLELQKDRDTRKWPVKFRDFRETAPRTVVLSSFHNSLDNRGSNWKIRLLPNPVGRIPNTSFLSATDRKQRFCSSLRHGMWGKSFSESLNALSNSSSVNREDAMLNMEKSWLLKSRRNILWRRAVYSNRVLRADRKADVNQTCQQSVFSPIGACIRIWCKRVPWNGGPKCLSTGLFAFPSPQFPARLKACSQATC